MADKIAYWMHKNEICTKLYISEQDNLVRFENYQTDPLLCAFGTMGSPVAISSLKNLLSTRFIPTRNGFEEKTFLASGLRLNPTIEEIIEINKGMIVDDFFWIKNGDDPSTFEEVRYNSGLGFVKKEDMAPLEEIQNTIFTENEKYGVQSLVTRASQDKWIYKGWFVKEDTAGYESITEVVAQILAKHIKNQDIDCIEYVLCPIFEGDRGVCASPIYTDMLGIEFVPFWDILEKYGQTGWLPPQAIDNGKALLDYTIGTVSKATGLNMEPFIKHMLMFDALIMNPDRHYNNMAVKRYPNNKYGLMPLYDHGLGLMSLRGYGKDKKNITARVYSKSFDRYIELAGEDYKLAIDICGLLKELKEKRNYFKEKEGYYAESYMYAEAFILERLLDTLNVAWFAVGDDASKINNTKYFAWLLAKDFEITDFDTEYQDYEKDMKEGSEMPILENLDKMAYGNRLRKG